VGEHRHELIFLAVRGLERFFGALALVHIGPRPDPLADGAIGGEKIKSGLPQVAESLGDDGMVGLEGLAHAYWSLHVQPKNAWTFEIDVRPYKEKW